MIFGTELQAASANHLLRMLHGRRVAGTLDDPAFAVHTMQYSEEQVTKALEYLRKHVNVNEVLNAGMRAEDELNELEADETVQPEKQDDDAQNGQQEEEAVEHKPDPVYGYSRFDQIRARNQAKERARQKAEEEARVLAEAEGRLPPSADDLRARSLVEVDEGARPITNPKIAEYYKQATSDIKEPPKLSAWERIGPSLVAFVLGVGFLASLTVIYKEPVERYRLFPEVSPAVATVGALVGLNVLVFAMWRIPPLWKMLNRYMIMVVGTPRPLSIFTANFSHQQFSHLALNMLLLGLAGVHLHEDLGRMGFLTMFLGCGAAGFLSGLIVYSAKGMLFITSLGASGAVIGLLGAYYWDHRDDRFKVLGLPQEGVHGIVWWGLLVGFHIFEAFSTFAVKNRTDVVGHWAGLLAGMAGIELLNWAGLGRRDRGEKTEFAGQEEGAGRGARVIVKDLLRGSTREETAPEKGRK